MDSPRFQAKGLKPGDNEYRDFYSQPRKGVEQRRIVISRNKLIWKIPFEKNCQLLWELCSTPSGVGN
jgi:hypothetical protein